MAYLPISAPTNAKYTITGPQGVIAVLNDSDDANWVGNATEVTGFDSPDIRESADDVVEGDGGLHGNFYYGRRPITFSGNIRGHLTLAGREIKEDKLGRATLAMRSDCTVAWVASSGAAVRVLARRQVPLRFTGGWLKEFQVGLVSASHLIEAQTQKGVGTTAGTALPQVIAGVENQGSVEALPERLLISGPITNPEVYNHATAKTMLYLIGTIPSGATWEINMKQHTVMHGTTNRYNTVDFLGTTWSGLASGVQNVELRGSGGGALTAWAMYYRDSWV